MFIASLAMTFSWLWVGWFAIFFVVEGIALYLDYKDNPATNQGGTLSEFVWRFRNSSRIAWALLAILMAVLTFHFLKG